jgi:DNA-binding LacI/PurR family transcriptional regulator
MNTQRRASVYDVAERAGTSIATVSRALNQPHRLSDEMRERVLTAIAELNYVPDGDAVARARSSKTRIAVVSPLRTFPGYAQRLRGIILALESTDAEVIVFHVDAARLKARKQFKYFDSLAASGRYDAIIVMSVPLQDQELTRLELTNFPLVLIETADDRFPSIQVDHQYGAELATEHLISKGYQPLGFMGFIGIQNYSLDTSQLREQGFRNVLERHNIEIRDEFIYKLDYGIESAYEAIRSLWKTEQRPRAIFCAVDVHALGVLKAAKELGIRVPEDLAIIGFDNIEMASYMELSTIEQPMEDTGRVAAELIQQLLEKSQVSTRKILLDLKLQARSTT